MAMNQDLYSLVDNERNASESGYVSVDNQNVQILQEEKPKKFPQYLTALAATLSAVATGMVLAWTSPIQDDLEKGNFRGIILNNNQIGWIGSFVNLGALIMCIPTGFICDIIGRKKTLLMLIVPFTAGWLLILFAKNVIMLYFGRLFTGMAAGACCTAVPIYINEIAHKSIRGALGSYYQLMVTFGIFLAYLVGKYLTSINYTLLCFCVPFGFVFSFIFAPETPTYLLKRGLSNEAKLSLTKLRGESYDVDSEINEIEGFLKEGTRIVISLTATLKKRSVIKAFLITLALNFFQQFSGVNSVIYYTSKIFVTSGANIDPQTASIIVGTVQVIATFISSLVIEKLGRRILLFVSSLIVTISLFQLAVYFTLKHRTNIDDHLLMELSFLPVASLCLFIIAFSLGLGPVPWFLTAELFPIEIKSVMASVAATFNWFFGFIVVKFYLSISGSIGEDSTFYFFTVISLVSSLFVYFVLPETKGKTSSEIQYILEN